jgi:uncharacterized membrane protein
MSNLIVLTYPDQESGQKVFAELDELQKQELLQLEDAALAFKDEKGKVKIKQTLEKQYTGAAAVWGGFWGLLVGLLFFTPIFWGVIGALLGGILGRTADIGIDNKFIKDVGDSLDPGGTAVFMLTTKITEDKVIEDLAQFGGQVYKTTLSSEDEELLKKALEHDQVRAAVHETLELE